MKPRTIYRMDKHLGRPLCLALTVWEHFRRLLTRRTPPPPRRLLFVKLVEMGSSVLACPAFEDAVGRFGQANVFIVVFEQNRPIIDLLPYFAAENVITIRDDNLAVFLHDLLRFAQRCRRERIDAAVDLEGLTRASAVITYLSGAPTRVGYYNFHSEGPYRGRLFTHELTYNFQHHVSEMFLALTRAASRSAGDPPLLKEPAACSGPLPAFGPREEEQQRVRAKLQSLAGREIRGPILLLNPNCSDLLPLRRWPESNMVELGRRLLDAKPDAVVVLTGSPSEQAAVEQIADRIGRPGRCLSMAGQTTLRELLTLYGLSDILISNDSGPCHFASLTALPVVALFGPESPLLYGPLGPRKTSLSLGLACSPCVNLLNHRFSPCRDNQCMKRLSVERVFETAMEWLQAEPAGTAAAVSPSRSAGSGEC